MGSMNVLVGPKGLQPGDELTFFYPSTEWSMAQPFTCLCGHQSCRGTISGAKDMTARQLEGTWLNGHIRELLEEQASNTSTAEDPTTRALQDALVQAEKVVEAARLAVRTYASSSSQKNDAAKTIAKTNGFATAQDVGFAEALNRRGPTSRELSGEMGGDTVV